jgi:mRNA interferase YafQ
MNKKYKLDYTTAFSRDLKKIKKRGYNIELLSAVVDQLQSGEPLAAKYKDHNLTGNWSGYRECHISPDWLLVYKVYEEQLLLVLSRTGTHSDLDF